MITMSTEQYKAMRQKPNKQSKYRNKRTERVLENGKTLKFDSLKEAARYDELMLLLKAGEISALRLQHSYLLCGSYTTPQGDKVKGITYVADFTYQRIRDKKYEFVVEDVKGVRTAEYLMKKSMMHDKYGITITEI